MKDVTEFISIYAKNKNSVRLNPVYEYKEVLEYIDLYKSTGKSWKYTQILEELGEPVVIKREADFELLHYPDAQSTSIKKFAKKMSITEDEVYLNYPEKIYRTTNAQSSIRKKVMDEAKNYVNGVVSIKYIPIKGKNANQLTEVLYNASNKDMFMFLSDMLECVDGKLMYKDKLNTLWDKIQYNNLVKEGGVAFPSGKKPEKLIENIIYISTNENDIVMDFHLGSGSTTATAHKMGRRYIGVEQMDYIEDITVERMKKVIEGEQGGISKAINWQGGGSFVYCELLENANTIISKVQETTEEDISQIKESIYSDERIVPYISKDELLLVNDEFESLSLEEKKAALIKLIDKNKLYVNYSDIEDTNFNVRDVDKNFTKSFYKEV